MRIARAFIGLLGFVCALALLSYGAVKVKNSKEGSCHDLSDSQCKGSDVCSFVCLTGPGNVVSCGCFDQRNVVEVVGATACILGIWLFVVSAATLISSCRGCCRKDDQFDLLEEEAL